ncbi:MAG: hypothetical protein ACR2FH_06245, partial [Caulobacteraceae bacterium]
MARKRKSARPSDPAAIAHRRAVERARERLIERDPAQWGINAAALDLAANADVEARPDPAGRAARIRRQDVFDRLRGRGALSQAALDAVRRLQGDIAVLHRATTGGGFEPRVDRSRDPQGFTDARRRAGPR